MGSHKLLPFCEIVEDPLSQMQVHASSLQLVLQKHRFDGIKGTREIKKQLQLVQVGSHHRVEVTQDQSPQRGAVVCGVLGTGTA